MTNAGWRAGDTMNETSVSVVVPAFNSERSLNELVQRIETVLGDTAAFEVLLINDGSRDKTWEVIENLSRTRHWVRGINLMRNYGQHNALLCGIREAKYDLIVTIDDDLEHPPEEIPKLLEKLEDGFDVVYGTPNQETHEFWRNLASRFTKVALQSAMGIEVAQNVTAFRAFRKPVREAFANYQGSFVSIDVLLTWGTTRFVAVPVSYRPRETGTSNYTFGMLVTHALNMVTGFSTLPLQIASVLGFLLTLFGIGILFYVIGRYLIQGGSVPGFPFLASIIAIFCGAQLFTLGIIGEYLARMHFRLMGRPAYVAHPQEHMEKQ